MPVEAEVLKEAAVTKEASQSQPNQFKTLPM
jgi:hypothetical protein